MKTLTEKYNALVEGKLSRDQFLRDARLLHPSLISRNNTFDDALSILINRGLVFPNITEVKAETETLIDKFPVEAVDRGVDVELEKMGLDSVEPPHEEDYEKALDKALKNLEKNVNFYLDQISYPVKNNKAKVHPAGNVDNVNKMVKVNPEKILKESIKDIIRNILSEQDDNTPKDIQQSNRERSIQIKNDLNSLLPQIEELIDLENADSKYIDQFADGLKELLKSKIVQKDTGIDFDLYEGRKFTYSGRII